MNDNEQSRSPTYLQGHVELTDAYVELGPKHRCYSDCCILGSTIKKEVITNSGPKSKLARGQSYQKSGPKTGLKTNDQ